MRKLVKHFKFRKYYTVHIYVNNWDHNMKEGKVSLGDQPPKYLLIYFGGKYWHL